MQQNLDSQKFLKIAFQIEIHRYSNSFFSISIDLVSCVTELVDIFIGFEDNLMEQPIVLIISS